MVNDCKGCGKSIVWGVTADGKKIPLDPRPAVYEAIENADGTTTARRVKAYVTHFATCSNANDFAASKKKA